MKTSDFDYVLPPELIAQTPAEPRDHSRLLVLDRQRRSLAHRHFHEIGDYMAAGDVLVLNDTRVLPARLKGDREGGGKAEILLLRRKDGGLWEALVRPGKKLKAGAEVRMGDGRVVVRIVDEAGSGIRVVELPPDVALDGLGEVPLPPYIHAPLSSPERYQTVFARVSGSVAAPTAGLHFTPELLSSLEQKGVRLVTLTLHIGLDTFRPVREDDPREHPIHREYGEISQAASSGLADARRDGRKVVAVGTSAARLLEAGASAVRKSQPFSGWVDLFILPGFRFQMVDVLVTNFHLPRSTNILLAAAFAGREFLLDAYAEAVRQSYRFYSFGDAMLVL